MTHDNFFGVDCPYKVGSYFYRVEFQQRGAPHIHCLLWLKDSDGKLAPTFWNSEADCAEEKDQTTKMKEIENVAKVLISGCENSIMCDKHHKESRELTQSRNSSNCKKCFTGNTDFLECSDHEIPKVFNNECQDCKILKQLVKDFQTHKHTFTCQKKNRIINIKKNEGHGRHDGVKEGPKISNYVHCRFNFPRFPMNKTTFILGIGKDLDKEEVTQRKKDYNKIKKYLIRQTFTEKDTEESESHKYMKSLSFLQFLHEVGMFETQRKLVRYSLKEKEAAYKKYINALSVSVRGTGAIFLKRNTEDLFTNNFNRSLLKLHKANHDVQIVVDQVKIFSSFSELYLIFNPFQYACAQYVVGYLTKNEDGMSKLLKAVNDQAGDISNMELLNKLSSVLDKNREVSIQEATYRILGLPMTKSSIKVKYLSTVHPHFRDGLLKGNIENLSKNE